MGVLRFQKGGEMPEEIKQEGATPAAEPAKEQQPPAEPKTETAEELKARLADVEKQLVNKRDEAARLHTKVEKFETEKLSETERLQKERDDALKTANELKTKQAQRDAADKVGLPPHLADRLKGATPEELEADAKMLLDSLPKVKKPGPTPASSPADGAQPASDDERRKFLFG